MKAEFESFVVEHRKVASGYIATQALCQFWKTCETSETIERIEFDSPLEQAFYEWFIAYQMVQQFATDNIAGDIRIRHHRLVTIGDETFELDFAIEPCVGEMEGWTPIAVEVDGHEFHERTRAQVALRDRRDRVLQAAGWKVFHYSFGEFSKASIACMAEIFDFAFRQYTSLRICQLSTEQFAEILARH